MDAEVYLEIVKGLGPLGVLVGVVVYLLLRERNHKKAGNPNGIIKAIDSLTTELREHNEKSNERMPVIMERLSNMGTLLGEIKTACIQMTERTGNPE